MTTAMGGLADTVNIAELRGCFTALDMTTKDKQRQRRGSGVLFNHRGG